MAILTTAITTFIVLVLIGIIVGLFFNRGGRGWLGRQVAGALDLEMRLTRWWASLALSWASTSASFWNCCQAFFSTSRRSWEPS